MKILSPKVIGLVIGVAVMSAIAAGFGTSANASASCVDQTLRSGSRGTCVYYAQKLINYTQRENTAQLGKPSYLKYDGVFGSHTYRQVRDIQAHASVSLRNSNGSQGRHVNLAKDGVIGKQTWAVLCTYSYAPNAYQKAAGCLKSNGRYKAFDYFYSTGLSRRAH